MSTCTNLIMAYNIVLLMIVMATSEVLAQKDTVVLSPHSQKPVAKEPSTRPHYTYNYQVQDPHSGDSKSQYEVRHGNTVQGSYSLIDPDGSKRIVEYYADPLSGFKAVVRREPLNDKSLNNYVFS